MRLSTLLASLGLVFVMTLALPAQTVRVIFVSGEASLQRPDEPALRAVVKGETVIIGTRIVTGADGRVVLTPMPGVKSIITPNTTVLLESSSESRTSPSETTHQATLDLKQGAVVSDLQKPEGVAYDYSIRTARGLAGARGTTFTVGMNPAGVQTILVAHGTISINFTDGRQASLALGQLSITQTNGSTQSVGKITDLPEADQKIAQNWTETTINAIAAALEAGIELDPAALNNALEAAKSLGITLSAETNANVQRALAKAQQLADTLNRIDPLSDIKDEIDQNTLKEIVAEDRGSPSHPTDPSGPDNPPDPDPTPRDLFLRSLTADQRAAFNALPSDIQTQLIELNDLTITNVALAPDPRTNLPHTHQDLRTQLTAFQQLSPEAIAFIKTLAGSDLAHFDSAPDSTEWSPAAFERTLVTWAALSPSEKEAIASLGAGKALMDKSAGYISALLDSLSPQQLDVIAETGWGAFLDELAGKTTGGNIMYNAAHTLDDAGRDAVKFFEITPNHFLSGSVYSLIEALAALSDADQKLVRQLGISDAALEALSYYYPAVALDIIPADHATRLQEALAFYNRLTSQEKSAARALELGYLFYHFAPDESVNESGTTALQRARSFAHFYLDNPSLQQALRDSRLFSSHTLALTPGSLDFDLITETLNTYTALPLRTRHYLANHDYSFYDLANPGTSYYSAAYRSLNTINNILTNLSASEFATLLDLDLGRVVFEVGDLGEGVDPFPFIDGSPVDEIKATVGYYNNLDTARKFVLRELGIIGDGNIAVIGADLDGLNRLLTAYGSLPGTLRAATERLNEYDTYFTTFGSNEGPAQDRSFFFPRGYRDYATIYGVSFHSTGDLHVGATRFLRIDGYYSEGPTFVTGDNKDLYLHAADLIDLNSTGFSANIRGITMAAATINLSNINFPEGSVASLNSKLGKVNFVNPDDVQFVQGKVNFYNVSYGGSSLNSTSDLTSPYGANGNIAIGTLKKPASLPTYQPRPIGN